MRFIAILLLLLTLVGCTKTVEKISPDIRSAFEATCRVETSESIGTGVLLDSGFIITAGHVVDANRNGELDYDELQLKVEFFAPVASVHTANVLFMGDWRNVEIEDFALLSIKEDMKSTIHIPSRGFYNSQPYGLNVFTIGAADGGTLRVTDGRLDQFVEFDGTDRTTCDILPGNSGGGLFTAGCDNLLGLVVEGYGTVSHNTFSLMIPIPNDRGELVPYIINGQLPIPTRAANWSHFISVEDIRCVAEANDLNFAINPVKNHLNPFAVYFGVLLNLALFLVLMKNGREFTKIILAR